MNRWLPVIGAALLLIVYLSTMAPSLTWAHYGADGGDLVRAVAKGSIPHPPGFPTYLLLGEIFIRLPLKNSAWRLNLMSAVLAAIAGGLTTLTAYRLQSQIHRPQAAICTGLCLGLAPLFWAQALITEVYAPAAFFAALVIALALRGDPIWLLGLVWGLGMGMHPTLLFLAPVVASGKRERPWFSAAQIGSLALLGWGLMYGPMLLMRGDVSSPWADVSTLEGWWALISGRLYHEYLFGLPLKALPRRISAWAGILVQQFTPLGALLTGIGWCDLWKERRRLATNSLLSFGAFSLYAIGYNTADSLVFLVPSLPLVALWLGTGLSQAVEWLEQRRQGVAWGLLLLPLLQALLFWGQMDVSQDRTAPDWAEQVLSEAPAQAVLLTGQDAHTFTLWYAQEVLEQRSDIIVLDVDLWSYEPYREMMTKTLGLADGSKNLSAEEAARRAGYSVVTTHN